MFKIKEKEITLLVILLVLAFIVRALYIESKQKPLLINETYTIDGQRLVLIEKFKEQRWIIDKNKNRLAWLCVVADKKFKKVYIAEYLYSTTFIPLIECKIIEEFSLLPCKDTRLLLDSELRQIAKNLGKRCCFESQEMLGIIYEY